MNTHTNFLLAATLLAASAASAQVVVLNDSFNDGGLTNGTDSLDTEWFRTNASLVTVSGGELTIANGRAAMGYLPGTPVTLTNTGDYISLSLDLTFTALSSNIAFAISLYDSGGTRYATGTDPISLGSGNASDAYAGYYSRFSQDGASVARAAATRETGLSAPFFGGADRTDVGGGTFGYTSFTVNTPSVVELRLTRVATGLQIEMIKDSVTLRSFTDTSPASYTFDTVVLYNQNVGSNVVIDNILVSVPEPSSVALLGFLGAAVWMWKLRANRRI